MLPIKKLASGSADKLHVMLIGKAADPRTFKDMSVEVKCMADIFSKLGL